MIVEKAGRALNVLLVEDDLEDADMTLQAVKESGVPCLVQLVRDGEEAVRALIGRGASAGSALPDLVLLDMQLPKLDGREVLARIRKDEGAKQLPVVVMTASRVLRTILEGEQLGVQGYLTKPVTAGQFSETVDRLRALTR
jgi:two-component system response regulator